MAVKGVCDVRLVRFVRVVRAIRIVRVVRVVRAVRIFRAVNVVRVVIDVEVVKSRAGLVYIHVSIASVVYRVLYLDFHTEIRTSRFISVQSLLS